MISPPRVYEYLSRARLRVLDWAQPLTPEQYAQPFSVGWGSLAKTLTHMLVSEWYYVLRIEGAVVPPMDQWPIDDACPPAFADLAAAWSRQTIRTRDALAAVVDWNAPIEYQIVDDDGKNVIIGTTPADIFTQLALHEVHHRAQALNMLRQLGVTTSDVDFNYMMYNRRPA